MNSEENSFEEEWIDQESNFDDTFEENYYPTEQSPEKNSVNQLLVKYIKNSNIELKNQSALILESIQLNTINALLYHNSNMVIHIPECINETCYKIADNFYNKYGEQYRKQIIFYPGIKLDEQSIRTMFCKQLPNIIFADFTNTFYSNKKTIEQILKCANEKNTNNLVLALTFSLRSEYHSITKLQDCKIQRGKTKNSDENVMNCITLSLLRIFYENGFTFNSTGYFDRYIYTRTLNKSRGGRMALYLFNLTKIKNSDHLNQVTELYKNVYLHIQDYPIKKL